MDNKRKIKTTTLDSLINKYNLKKIDLLMIDTEGYDFEIIKSIPFDKVKPLVIVFEHSHFSENTVKDCYEFLKNKSYTLQKTASDTIAVLK